MHTSKSKNARVLLGPVATEFATVNTGSWRTERPKVDVSECVTCGVCSQHCPAGAIEIRKQEQQCVFVDWYTCKGCGICANLCPKQCINMMPEREGDVN
jgi:pyruvate ferredoxin oxidoreductase delta subunit